MKQYLVFTMVCIVMLLTACSDTEDLPNGGKEDTHEAITLEFKAMMDNDAHLKAMFEENLALAKAINPDKNYNPAQSLEEFYDFMDWSVKCMPWNVLGVEYPTLYTQIDQGIGYFWFIFDQPLDELKDKGYYYPTLQYQEPIASWIKKYSQTWGNYLSTPESWNTDYYNLVKNDSIFNMDKGWYASTNVWNTYNEFFARHLIDASVRPINDAAVVAPTDATPMGLWAIDDNNQLVTPEGVDIKSGHFTSISQLLGPGTNYADAFAGGSLTHMFLDVNDYHRFHSPVDGVIVELRQIPGANAGGGITTWNPVTQRYVYNNELGWQMIETRNCAIIQTENYGLVALMPIGMSQICSVNWETTLAVGESVKKGDAMGYFSFGGSDIVLLFQNNMDVTLLAPFDGENYSHLLMGENYASLKKKNEL